MQNPADLPILTEPIRIALEELCRKFRVRKLALFGSATGQSFNPARSDIDILVEFLEMPPREHMENYFGLSEELTQLFHRPVDLVEEVSIKNPYVLASIQKSQVPVYAAA